MLRPCVISISGYDPSGAAGFSGDLKTFEANKVYGFSAMTALTFQNEFQITSIKWVGINSILKQIELQFMNHSINIAKIGLTQSLQVVLQISRRLKILNPRIKVIWDPILESSSAFNFKISISENLLKEIVKDIFLITPNRDEYKELGSQVFLKQALSNQCSVYLKGGHSQANANDTLYLSTHKVLLDSPRLEKKFDKHGTGCVLSSVIAAQLSLGKSLEKSCKIAKKYVKVFMQSSAGLIGYHEFT